MKISTLTTTFLLVFSSATAFADSPALDHGSFGQSCAPWDGAAVRFGINGAGSQYPQIGFSLFKGEKEVTTGAYTLPLDGHDGNVNYCTGPQACQIIDKGTVTLTDFKPWTTAHISYDLTLDDGTALKGEASLTGSAEKQFCG